MGSSVWSCKHFSSWISLSDCSLVKGPCLAPPVPSVQLSEAARPGSSQSHVHQTIPTPTYLVKGDLHLFPAVLGTFWWEGGHHPSGALSVPCGCGLWHFGVVCFIGASLLILLPWAWGGVQLSVRSSLHSHSKAWFLSFFWATCRATVAVTRDPKSSLIFLPRGLKRRFIKDTFLNEPWNLLWVRSMSTFFFPRALSEQETYPRSSMQFWKKHFVILAELGIMVKLNLQIQVCH